jgi:hypothetical protein
MAAVRLSFTWLGVRKTLTAEQKRRAADPFGAEATFLSAGKKLLDTAHPAFREVTAVRGRAVADWKHVTLPYPEPGLRLIRQDALARFEHRLQGYQQALATAVQALEAQYAELRDAARQRLGALYNASDYPASLVGLFVLEYEFPSVEPPDYLRRLHPELYAQECRRVQQRFEAAVQLAEAAFLAEFSQLVAHLCERLSGERDGSPKVFRNSAVTHLTAFFERFRSLQVGSDAELDRLVTQAQQVVRGLSPQALREDLPLRQRIATQLAGVQSVLEGLLVDRPRRNILRGARPEAE